MGERSKRVSVEAIDWPTTLPVVHLFQSFRMALQPAKLVLALALVVVVVLGGRGLDLAWGPAVEAGEFQRYTQQNWTRLTPWAQHLQPQPKPKQTATLAPAQTQAAPNQSPRPSEHKAGSSQSPLPSEHRPGSSQSPLPAGDRVRGDAQADDPSPSQKTGVFDTALRIETRAFASLIQSVTGFNLEPQTVVLPGGAWSEASWSIAVMFVVVPGWLATHHPMFLAVFALGKLLVVALIGGAICRLAAVEACQELRGSVNEGLRFAGLRYPWLVLAPLIPLGVIAVIAVLLAAAGGVLFNLPVGDIFGALLLPLFVLGGLVIALVAIGLVVGAHLLYPGIAVEGTDAFDAISRAFNYIFGRPWKWALYTLVMLIYGLITFLFFGGILYLALTAAHWALGGWVVSDVGQGASRFEAIMPAPELGQLVRSANWPALQGYGTASVAAWIAGIWLRLLVGLLPAFTVSYYFCAHTWIYLLLRRAADGTEFDDLYLEEAIPNPDAGPPIDTTGPNAEGNTNA
jgi:hypothetical protein